MNRIVLILVIFFSVNSLFSQNNENKYDEDLKDTIYDATKVDKQAEFKGGQKEMMNFLVKNIRYPRDTPSSTSEISGKVFIEFVVNKQGNIIRAKVYKGVYTSLDKEALRVVNKFPKWNPAVHRGNNVFQRYVLPINFKIQ